MNEYKHFITNIVDVTKEEEITEQEFNDIVKRFRDNLMLESGYTYKKYYIVDNGKRSRHYIVKRLVGVNINE